MKPITHGLARDEGLAVGRLDMAQHAGGMADEGDGLAGPEGGLDEPHRGGAATQIVETPCVGAGKALFTRPALARALS
jgi:hypothetical protein